MDMDKLIVDPQSLVPRLDDDFPPPGGGGGTTGRSGQGGITFGSVGAVGGGDAGAGSPQVRHHHLPQAQQQQQQQQQQQEYRRALPPDLAGAPRVVGPPGSLSPQQQHRHPGSPMSSAAVGGPTAGSLSPQSQHHSPLVGATSTAGAPNSSSLFSSSATIGGLSDFPSAASALPPPASVDSLAGSSLADLERDHRDHVADSRDHQAGAGSPLLSHQRSPTLRGSRAPGSGRIPSGGGGGGGGGSGTMGVGVGVGVPAQPPVGTMGVGVGVGVPSSSALRGAAGGRGMRPYRGGRGHFGHRGRRGFSQMHRGGPRHPHYAPVNPSHSAGPGGGGGGGGLSPSSSDLDGLAGGLPGGTPRVSNRCFVGNIDWKISWQDLKDHMRHAGNVVRADILTDRHGRSLGCGIVEYETIEDAQNAINTLSDSELGSRNIFVREDREERGYGWSAPNGRGGGGGGQQRGTGAAGDPSAGIGAGAGAAAFHQPPAPYHHAHQHPQHHAHHAHSMQQQQPSPHHAHQQPSPHHAHQHHHHHHAHQHHLGGGVGGPPDLSGAGGGPADPDAPGGPSSGGGVAQHHLQEGYTLYVGNLPYSTTWQNLKDLFSKYGEVLRSDVMTYPNGQSKGFGTVRFATESESVNAIVQLHRSELYGRPIIVRKWMD